MNQYVNYVILNCFFYQTVTVSGVLDNAYYTENNETFAVHDNDMAVLTVGLPASLDLTGLWESNLQLEQGGPWISSGKPTFIPSLGGN